MAYIKAQRLSLHSSNRAVSELSYSYTPCPFVLAAPLRFHFYHDLSTMLLLFLAIY